jgi:hypothetical protein
LQTDYEDETTLKALLESNQIHTIVSALNVDFEPVSNAQVRLIKAAAATNCVKRFIPSEYNVNYDLPDSILPYPEKKWHLAARRAIEQTNLEYTYVYPGMFLDYLGFPRVKSHMRPLYIVLDLENKEIRIPGDGDARVTFTCTVDAARAISTLLDVVHWPREVKVVGSELTLNELAKLAKTLVPDVKIDYDSIESLLKHEAGWLTGNKVNGSHFEGGADQLRDLLCDLNAGIALGAYDLSKNSAAIDVTSLIDPGTFKPLGVTSFLQRIWI